MKKSDVVYVLLSEGTPVKAYEDNEDAGRVISEIEGLLPGVTEKLTLIEIPIIARSNEKPSRARVSYPLEFESDWKVLSSKTDKYINKYNTFKKWAEERDGDSDVREQ